MPPESSPENTNKAEEADKALKAEDVKATPAESSPADPAVKAEAKTDKGEKPDMLAAVKAALKPAEKTPDSDKPDPKSEITTAEVAEGDKAADETDELTDEETARLKPKTRKRIENLVASNKAREDEIGQLRPQAEQFQKVVGFMESADLVPDEVNQLFNIGRDLKKNPRAAYEAIKPVYETLQRMYGEILPDDLQARVNQGLITAEDAKALAVARTNESVATQTARRQEEREKARRAQESQQVQINEVKAKVSEWETSKEKSDPDWNLKSPQVMRAIKNALYERGTPPNAVEAVQIAEAALAEVNAEFKKLAPRKREIVPVNDVSSTASTPKPTTPLEAARQGLARMRGG